MTQRSSHHNIMLNASFLQNNTHKILVIKIHRSNVKIQLEEVKLTKLNYSLFLKSISLLSIAPWAPPELGTLTTPSLQVENSVLWLRQLISTQLLSVLPLQRPSPPKALIQPPFKEGVVHFGISPHFHH